MTPKPIPNVFVITWTRFDGTQRDFHTMRRPGETDSAMRARAFDEAYAEGWHSPRWYEFWRVGDTKWESVAK